MTGSTPTYPFPDHIPVTIETHLAHFVGLGELDGADLVSKEKGRESLSLIKEHLGDGCSYGEIRLVLESMHS